MQGRGGPCLDISIPMDVKVWVNRDRSYVFHHLYSLAAQLVRHWDKGPFVAGSIPAGVKI